MNRRPSRRLVHTPVDLIERKRACEDVAGPFVFKACLEEEAMEADAGRHGMHRWPQG